MTVSLCIFVSYNTQQGSHTLQHPLSFAAVCSFEQLRNINSGEVNRSLSFYRDVMCVFTAFSFYDDSYGWLQIFQPV